MSTYRWIWAACVKKPSLALSNVDTCVVVLLRCGDDVSEYTFTERIPAPREWVSSRGASWKGCAVLIVSGAEVGYGLHAGAETFYRELVELNVGVSLCVMGKAMPWPFHGATVDLCKWEIAHVDA
jgi:hypothetical protein